MPIMLRKIGFEVEQMLTDEEVQGMEEGVLRPEGRMSVALVVVVVVMGNCPTCCEVKENTFCSVEENLQMMEKDSYRKQPDQGAELTVEALGVANCNVAASV